MELKFESNLEYQNKAVFSVVNVFKGQKKQVKYDLPTICNPTISISNEEILLNINSIQQKNNLPITKHIEYSNDEGLSNILNLTIEMETGTGKTYVYLKTIFELYNRYGFCKFIIVVPSVAIKEGVIKSLEITKEHFKQLYENLPYTYFNYNSNKLIYLRDFSNGNILKIMIITRDAFNKDTNIIHNNHDLMMGDKPIDLIKRTNPIVILDEPQKLGGKSTVWGLSELNPLFIIRYSATHKETFNLIYRLTPFEAYELGLVKKISILSMLDDENATDKKIILEDITSTKDGLRAKIKAFKKEKNGIKLASITLKQDDELFKKTKNPYYENLGLQVIEINIAHKYVKFTNGIKVTLGESTEEQDEFIRLMIRETIKQHLEKKRILNKKGIKVLSLFFINKVDDYLSDNPVVKATFESEFIELIKSSEFMEFSNLDLSKIYKGYFSRMRTDKGIENDDSAFNLIMKEKERLLSLEEPVEFIFSHSALREGWDNPNVFNVCTLSYAYSEIRKRQEIGRGLRLPVDSSGKRIKDENINKLTIITNESYKEYIEKLQTEFLEDGITEKTPPAENEKKRKKLILKEEALSNEDFKNLWNKLKYKSRYRVNLNTSDFIKDCVEGINKIEINELKIKIEEVSITKLGYDNYDYQITSEGGKIKKLKSFPNIITYLKQETGLIKQTIFDIIRKVSNFSLFFKNPQKYIDKIIMVIKDILKEHITKNIYYEDLEEQYSIEEVFDKTFESYEKYIVSLNEKKTLYKLENGTIDAIKIDTSSSEEGISKTEKEFSEKLDKYNEAKFFFKIPSKYSIPTPFGNYTPDWGIVIKKLTNGHKEYSFVIETKGIVNDSLSNLRIEEQAKILSAKAFFENKNIKFDYTNNFESFIRKII